MGSRGLSALVVLAVVVLGLAVAVESSGTSHEQSNERIGEQDHSWTSRRLMRTVTSRRTLKKKVLSHVHAQTEQVPVSEELGVAQQVQAPPPVADVPAEGEQAVLQSGELQQGLVAPGQEADGAAEDGQVGGENVAAEMAAVHAHAASGAAAAHAATAQLVGGAVEGDDSQIQDQNAEGIGAAVEDGGEVPGQLEGQEELGQAVAEAGEEELPPGAEVGEEELPPGVEVGEEELPPGAEVGEEELPPGAEVGEEELPPGVEAREEELPPGAEAGQEELAPVAEAGQEELAPVAEAGQEDLAPVAEAGRAELAPGVEAGAYVAAGTEGSETVSDAAGEIAAAAVAAGVVPGNVDGVAGDQNSGGVEGDVAVAQREAEVMANQGEEASRQVEAGEVVTQHLVPADGADGEGADAAADDGAYYEDDGATDTAAEEVTDDAADIGVDDVEGNDGEAVARTGAEEAEYEYVGGNDAEAGADSGAEDGAYEVSDADGAYDASEDAAYYAHSDEVAPEDADEVDDDAANGYEQGAAENTGDYGKDDVEDQGYNDPSGSEADDEEDTLDDEGPERSVLEGGHGSPLIGSVRLNMADESIEVNGVHFIGLPNLRCKYMDADGVFLMAVHAKFISNRRITCPFPGFSNLRRYSSAELPEIYVKVANSGDHFSNKQMIHVDYADFASGTSSRSKYAALVIGLAIFGVCTLLVARAGVQRNQDKRGAEAKPLFGSSAKSKPQGFVGGASLRQRGGGISQGDPQAQDLEGGLEPSKEDFASDAKEA